MALGGVEFSSLFISLDGKSYPSLAVATATSAPTINYEVFINTILEFLIIVLVLFFLIKGINKSKRNEEAPPPVLRIAFIAKRAFLKRQCVVLIAHQISLALESEIG